MAKGGEGWRRVAKGGEGLQQLPRLGNVGQPNGDCHAAEDGAHRHVFGKQRRQIVLKASQHCSQSEQSLQVEQI